MIRPGWFLTGIYFMGLIVTIFSYSMGAIGFNMLLIMSIYAISATILNYIVLTESFLKMFHKPSEVNNG